MERGLRYRRHVQGSTVEEELIMVERDLRPALTMVKESDLPLLPPTFSRGFSRGFWLALTVLAVLLIWGALP